MLLRPPHKLSLAPLPDLPTVALPAVSPRTTRVLAAPARRPVIVNRLVLYSFVDTEPLAMLRQARHWYMREWKVEPLRILFSDAWWLALPPELRRAWGLQHHCVCEPAPLPAETVLVWGRPTVYE